jgi:hypothetical protein
LDVAGLVPGYGEPADLANALWYIQEGDYFSAVLSIISMIPDVGDVVGKGIKYLGKFAWGARAIAKYGPIVEKWWPRVQGAVARSGKLKPYARILDKAAKDMVAKYRSIAAGAKQQAQGVQSAQGAQQVQSAQGAQSGAPR